METPKKQIRLARKALYYGGMALTALGLVTLIGFSNVAGPANAEALKFAGMMSAILGLYMTGIGAQGWAKPGVAPRSENLTAGHQRGRLLLIWAILLGGFVLVLVFCQGLLLNGFEFSNARFLLFGLFLALPLLLNRLWTGSSRSRWVLAGAFGLFTMISFGSTILLLFLNSQGGADGEAFSIGMKWIPWLWLGTGVVSVVGCCLLLHPSVGAFLEHKRGICSQPTKPKGEPLATSESSALPRAAEADGLLEEANLERKSGQE